MILILSLLFEIRYLIQSLDPLVFVLGGFYETVQADSILTVVSPNPSLIPIYDDLIYFPVKKIFFAFKAIIYTVKVFEFFNYFRFIIFNIGNQEVSYNDEPLIY